ncbi:MAG: sel1 repeat family protein [Ruminococcus sp.]|nr:sel1 repeat family protein [Ruminococcus sp.]
MKGEVVEEHLGNAAFWFHKAADQGYSPAQYNLGFCFYYGYGVEANRKKSKSYFKQAADQGCEEAIEFLKEKF